MIEILELKELFSGINKIQLICPLSVYCNKNGCTSVKYSSNTTTTHRIWSAPILTNLKLVWEM